jgi:hypothetical protein
MNSRLKRLGAAAGVSVGLFAGGMVAATPAQAGTVYADCAVGLYGKNNDGVTIACGDVVGGQARGRADCKAAPDIYTKWIGAWASDSNGWCLFSARGAILETRAF